MFDAPLCRRSLFAARCAVLCVASLLLCPVRTPAQDYGNQPKRVLLLYSFDNDEGMYSGFDQVLRSELRSGLRERVEFYTEYLDLVRFPGPGHASNLVKLLKLEFSEQKPDLIIPVSYSAMKFLLEEGKELFPGIPAVALFNSRRLDEVKRRISTGTAGRDITGVASADEPSRTLDLALRLQPDTQRVVVVVGSSPLEQYWLEQLKQDFLPYRHTVEIDFLTDVAMSDILKQVAALPPHCIVLNTFFFEDSRGQFFSGTGSLGSGGQCRSRAGICDLFHRYRAWRDWRPNDKSGECREENCAVCDSCSQWRKLGKDSDRARQFGAGYR